MNIVRTIVFTIVTCLTWPCAAKSSQAACNSAKARATSAKAIRDRAENAWNDCLSKEGNTGGDCMSQEERFKAADFAYGRALDAQAAACN